MPNYWFDHVHLFGPDRMKTVEFYVKMFGAKQLSQRDYGDGRIAVHLDLNGTEILVSKSDEIHTPGLHHFGIRTDSLTKAVKELKGKGVTFITDIIEVAPGIKLSHLKAAENVTIELQEGTIYSVPLCEKL